MYKKQKQYTMKKEAFEKWMNSIAAKAERRFDDIIGEGMPSLMYS